MDINVAMPMAVLLAMVLIWLIIFGARRWRELGGKIIVIGAGMLLAGLILFVSFIALIVTGIQNNAPL